MVCIYCSGETKVTNSRLQKRLNQIWRRRKCLQCGAIFSTEERAVTDTSLLVKAGSHVEPFYRDKLLLSFYEALRHRKTAVNDATALYDTVWSKLYVRNTNAQLERDEVVAVAHEVLKRFDKAAATTYLAYHPLSG